MHGKNKHEHLLKVAEDRFGDRYSFPHIEEEYGNSHSKITVRCNLCGREFVKIACDFVTSKTGGCKCRETSITHEELTMLANGYDVENFDGYRSRSKDKVALTCRKCGYTYDAKISSVIKGKCTCKSCNGKKVGEARKVSLDEVKQRMVESFPKITVDYTNYTGTMEKLPCKCNDCGHEFERSVNAFFYGNTLLDACPNCSRELQNKKRTKTTEEFIDDINMVYGEGNYTLLGEYTTSNKKVDVRCNDCGREFSIEANSFLQGHGCPYHNCNSSRKEKEIADFIRAIYDGEVLNNDRNLISGKELDIYVPSLKLAFEFDGIFWHNENNKPKRYHLDKTEDCAEKGIRLIHIFEDEWMNKRKIWESMILNILGATPNKIHARKCIVREVGTKECTKFLEENHLQGWCPSQMKLGLYHNDELVSVMTFGKSRHFVGIGGNGIEYELLRYCNKLNTSVIGGASKLFSHFVKAYDPNSVVSYADRRWSQGNLYDNLGFTLSHSSRPNYYYVVGNERKNRFNFRKSVLVEKYGCPLEMSEREFCRQQKWHRIYDCGALVYKWFKKN